MIRWLENRLAGRKFYKSQTLDVRDIPNIIQQITGDGVRDDDVRIDFNDGYGDFYYRADLQNKIKRLRDLVLNNSGNVREITMSTYVGKNSMKNYVEIHAQETNVSLEYILRIQKKNNEQTHTL